MTYLTHWTRYYVYADMNYDDMRVEQIQILKDRGNIYLNIKSEGRNQRYVVHQEEERVIVDTTESAGTR